MDPRRKLLLPFSYVNTVSNHILNGYSIGKHSSHVFIKAGSFAANRGYDRNLPLIKMQKVTVRVTSPN